MKDKVCVFTFWAILMATALAGCARMNAFTAMATAKPIYGADDPEQPLRSSDYSGLIVSVTHERISIRSGARLGGEYGEYGAALATITSASAASTLDVPFAQGVLIRQSRDSESAEFLNLLPYEIVPGLHAEVWLDSEGNAAYIRVSVRKRLDE